MKKQTNKTKPIIIRLDAVSHKKMRHISVDTGKSINSYVASAVEKIIKDYENGKIK